MIVKKPILKFVVFAQGIVEVQCPGECAFTVSVAMITNTCL
jgi:hypothetical protein